MPTTEIVSILKILELLQSWPVWMVGVVLLLSPWLAVIYLSRCADKRAELERAQAAERAAATEKAAAERAAAHDLKSAENLATLTKIAQAGWDAYRDNVELVRETQAVAKQAVALAGELAEIVALNTQAQTVLTETIRNNQFCPTVRRAAGKD